MKTALNQPDYSTFDLSALHRTSFDMGYLVPIHVLPTLPGDYINVDIDAFVRGMPTIAPIVDKVDIKINHFYVPYRVLHEEFTEFISHDDTYTARGTIKPKIPTAITPENYNPAQGTYQLGRLLDYLGIPESIDADTDISLYPILAYQKIFLDYYAPQRWVEYLQTNGVAHPLVTLKGQLERMKRTGYINNFAERIYTYDTNYAELFKLRKVGWNHDYFTNALPKPSLFEDIKVPLFNEDVTPTNSYFINDTNYNQTHFGSVFGAAGTSNEAKLATIRDLRKSVALQHYFERLQISGGRYMENMKVFWGQDIDNKTLQRSEYLGGDVIPLFVNEVESTAGTTQNNLGDLAGKPVGAGKFGNINFQADEFGVYMAIAHVVPKRSYTTTLQRFWKQFEPLDFPNPAFEDIGDQAVYSWELTGRGDDVFGYVPRYSEYKGGIDKFTGEMRHSLTQWHLGTFTPVEPEISPSFIECNPREDIFVTQEPDKFLGTFKVNVKAKRKLQVNSIGGLSRL